MDDLPVTGAAGSSVTSDRHSPVAPWTGLFTGIALALAVVAALQILGATMAGLAVPQEPLGTSYNVGYLFFKTLDAFPIGLVFILAVVLTLLPSMVDARTTARQNRAATVALGITAAFGFLLIVMSVLAILASIQFVEARGQKLGPVPQRELMTFFVRHVGTSVIAFAAALFAIRSRVDLGPVGPRPATAATPPTGNDVESSPPA